MLLAGWFGVRDVPDLPARREGIPGGLLRCHRVLGAYPDAFLQNDLLPVSELAPRGGRIEFLRENQGVARWSLDLADIGLDDPPVWAEMRGVRALEPERLQRFMIEAVLVELVTAHGTAASGGPDADGREQALDPLERLGLGPLSFPPATTFYAGDDLLAMVSEEPGQTPWLWIASRSEASITYLDAIVGQPRDGSPWEGYRRWPL